MIDVKWILNISLVVTAACMVSCASQSQVLSDTPARVPTPADPAATISQGVDDDADGVENFKDSCPDSPKGGSVGRNGCPKAVLEVAPLYKNIGFGSGRAQLKAGAYVVLDQIVASLKARPHIDIELRGHADSLGVAQYNQQLALRRARAVKIYLVGQGIDEARVFTVTMGSTRPMATNETPEGRALNRRVEAFPIL